MDDDLTREDRIARVDARTSERVSRMSEDERIELARELARRRGAAADAPPAEPMAKPAEPAMPTRPVAPDASVVARLTAELRSTERRLDRLERFTAPARFTSSPQINGRYERLVSRAERLERKLRGLS